MEKSGDLKGWNLNSLRVVPKLGPKLKTCGRKKTDKLVATGQRWGILSWIAMIQKFHGWISSRLCPIKEVSFDVVKELDIDGACNPS